MHTYDENYIELGSSIVAQALADYYKCLFICMWHVSPLTGRKYKDGRKLDTYKYQLDELEKFFNSSWCEQLTTVNIQKVKGEIYQLCLDKKIVRPYRTKQKDLM